MGVAAAPKDETKSAKRQLLIGSFDPDRTRAILGFAILVYLATLCGSAMLALIVNFPELDAAKVAFPAREKALMPAQAPHRQQGQRQAGVRRRPSHCLLSLRRFSVGARPAQVSAP